VLLFVVLDVDVHPSNPQFRRIRNILTPASDAGPKWVFCAFHYLRHSHYWTVRSLVLPRSTSNECSIDNGTSCSCAAGRSLHWSSPVLYTGWKTIHLPAAASRSTCSYWHQPDKRRHIQITGCPMDQRCASCSSTVSILADITMSNY
jgi:hypothetical protein